MFVPEKARARLSVQDEQPSTRMTRRVLAGGSDAGAPAAVTEAMTAASTSARSAAPTRVLIFMVRLPSRNLFSPDMSGRHESVAGRIAETSRRSKSVGHDVRRRAATGDR